MGNLFERGPLIDTSGALLSDWKWIIDNGTSVTAGVTGENETKTVYEVPADKVLYISYVFLSMMISTSGGGDAELIIGGALGGTIMDIHAPGVANFSFAVSSALNMPIKLLAGEKVEIYSSLETLKCHGAFTGYLLDA